MYNVSKHFYAIITRHSTARARHDMESSGLTYFQFDPKLQPTHTREIAPVAETGFSHRLTVYKIVGYFFVLSYRNITGNNQVEK